MAGSAWEESGWASLSWLEMLGWLCKRALLGLQMTYRAGQVGASGRKRDSGSSSRDSGLGS